MKKSDISGSTRRIKMIKASKFVINVSMKRQVFFARECYFFNTSGRAVSIVKN